MAYLQVDDNGNPIWLPDVDGLLDAPGVPEIGGGVPHPEAGVTPPGMAPQMAPASPEDQARQALANINGQLSPGTGPAAGNQVPQGSPYAARPNDPYTRAPGAATVDRQFDASGKQVAGTIAQQGELGGPDIPKPKAAGPMDPAAQAEAAQLATLDQRAPLEKNAIDAELQAQRDLVSRRAAVQTQHAEQLGIADRDYQNARTAARADAERETAEWQMAIEKKAKEEPSRSRWWENTTDFGKALWLMSLAFGTYGASKAPGIQNVAMKMIQDQIAGDVTMQKERMEREMRALEGKGARLDKKHDKDLAVLNEDHTMLYQRLMGLRDAAMEKAAAPGTADQRAAYGKAALTIQGKLEEIGAQRTERAYKAREGALDRQAENSRNWSRLAMQEKLAKLEETRLRDFKAADITQAYDLAQMSVDAKAGGQGAAGPFKPEDIRTIPTQTGIRVVDSKGNAIGGAGGALRMHKDNETPARNLAAAAQEKWEAMQTVSEELGKGEDLGLILKDNPRLQAAIITLGYRESKDLDPRAITTDKDLAAAMQAAFGGDINSLKGRFATATGIGPNQEQIKKFVDQGLRDMPKRVSNHLTSLVDTQLPGYEGDFRVDWTPNNLRQEEAKAPTGSQIDDRYGVAKPAPELQTIDDLKRNRELGDDALPPFKKGNAPKVTAFAKEAEYSTPSQIRERAVKALEAVKGDKRAELTIQETVDTASKKQGQRLKDLEEDLEVTEAMRRQGDEVRKVTRPTSTSRTEADKAKEARKLAVDNGLGDIPPEDLLRLIEKVNRRLDKEN